MVGLLSLDAGLFHSYSVTRAQTETQRLTHRRPTRSSRGLFFSLANSGEKGDQSSKTLGMAAEAEGDPRAWVSVDETAAAFLSRSLATRPPIILPPPLHRAPLRPGNVVEIIGPSNSGKSHLLLVVSVAPTLYLIISVPTK
jgi:hypothetical protein